MNLACLYETWLFWQNSFFSNWKLFCWKILANTIDYHDCNEFVPYFESEFSFNYWPSNLVILFFSKIKEFFIKFTFPICRYLQIVIKLSLNFLSDKLNRLSFFSLIINHFIQSFYHSYGSFLNLFQFCNIFLELYVGIIIPIAK